VNLHGRTRRLATTSEIARPCRVPSGLYLSLWARTEVKSSIGACSLGGIDGRSALNVLWSEAQPVQSAECASCTLSSHDCGKGWTRMSGGHFRSVLHPLLQGHPCEVQTNHAAEWRVLCQAAYDLEGVLQSENQGIYITFSQLHRRIARQSPT